MKPGDKESKKKLQPQNILSQAFEHKEALVGYAFCIVKNWQTAEDVVQEAFLVIGNKWENFQPGTSVFAWSRNIVRLECFKMIRSVERETPVEQDRLDAFIESKLDNIWDNSATGMVQEQLNLLRECVTDLQENAKKLLLDFYLHGHSYKQISKNTDNNINHVKDRLFRLRRKLRNCVNSKSSQKRSDAIDTSANPEFLDDIYYGENSQAEREVILNQLEQDPEMAERHILAFLLEHVTLAVVSKQMHFAEAAQKEETSEKKKESVSDLQGFTMGDLSTPETIESAPLELAKKQPISFPFLALQGLAACLIIGAGIVWWNTRDSNTVEFAKISNISGNVTLLRLNGVQEKGLLGMEVHPGDIIETSSNTSVSIALSNDDSKVILSENSKFQMANNAIESFRENNYYLHIGQLEAKINRQPAGSPTVFSTNSTDCIVLGTRFRLNRSPISDRLEVIDGRVKFFNVESKSSVIVTGGQSYHVYRGSNSIIPSTPPEGKSRTLTSTDEIPLTLSANGLVRALHFEKTFNQSFIDSSPYRQPAIANNISSSDITYGRQGNGLKLDGTGFLNLGKSKELNLKDSFTISCQVMFNGNEKHNKGLILQQNASSDDFVYKITGGPSEIRMTVNAKDGKSYSVKVKENFRKWKLLVFTLKEGNLNCYTHLNTLQMRDTISVNSSLIESKEASLLLGSAHSTPTFQGIIDDVIIYNRALSPREIHSLALLHHVRMNHNFENLNDSFALDASPFSLDAEIIGSASTQMGKFGQALTLNGDGYLRIENGPIIQKSFFFELWVRGDKTKNPELVELLSKQSVFQLNIDNRDLNATKLAIHFVDNRTEKHMLLPFPILDKQWHHIIVSFSRQETTLQMFVDETQYTEIPCSNLHLTPNANIFIGGSKKENSFVGQIDQIHFSHFRYSIFKSLVEAKIFIPHLSG